MITVFNGGPELIGSVVTVRVTDASPLTLFGEVESIASPARPPAEIPTTLGTPLPMLTARS
jgi:hypothetical protein